MTKYFYVFYPAVHHLKDSLHSDGATVLDTEDFTIADLFKCLPVIEYLSLKFYIVEAFSSKETSKRASNNIGPLEMPAIEIFWFCHKYGLPFLVLLIRSSPNLEKLELVVNNKNLFYVVFYLF